MKKVLSLLFLFTFTQYLFAEDELCSHYDDFLTSIEVDQIRTIELRTVWGSGFKDEPKDDSVFTLGAKRCEFFEYSPAKQLCDYLMKNTSTEFAGSNFISTLKCLSPGTTFNKITFRSAYIELSYGNEDRGVIVDLSLSEDDEIGGMVLKLVAEGY